MREQFPGIARLDSWISAAIDLFIGFIVLLIMYTGCQGYFLLTLSDKYYDKQYHKPLGLGVLIFLITKVVIAVNKIGDAYSRAQHNIFHDPDYATKVYWTDAQIQTYVDHQMIWIYSLIFVPMIGWGFVLGARLRGRYVTLFG